MVEIFDFITFVARDYYNINVYPEIFIDINIYIQNRMINFKNKICQIINKLIIDTRIEISYSKSVVWYYQ